MIILGIDTSCDDTAIALLEIKDGKFKVLSNIISSQVDLHQSYGGVYPSLAKREHIKNLPAVLKEALKIEEDKIDYIAVTVGPGLDPCLWAGINFAEELRDKWKKPIIPINHIEGHILSSMEEIKFPSLSLVVSGGHTELILMKEFGNYEIIGETRDDAAGECFDKTARILGLPYPGGPEISRIAEKGDMDPLPRPMIYAKNYDFSFSGLKTAVLYHHKNTPEKVRESKSYVKMMAYEIQESIVDVLVKKTKKAVQEYGIKSVVVGGGVSANKRLREKMKELDVPVIFPDTELSMDNGLMIAVAGYYNRDKATFNKLKSIPNLKIC